MNILGYKEITEGGLVGWEGVQLIHTLLFICVHDQYAP